MSMKKTKTLFMCSIYKDRPDTCRQYPWNHANKLFKDCIFVDMENEKLRTKEEQLKLNTQDEINDYCVSCGRCCFYGPGQCSMLRITEVEEGE